MMKDNKLFFIFVIFLRILPFNFGGIAGLSKFFRSRYSSAYMDVTTKNPLESDHLLIDMNELLYASFGKAQDSKYFMARTFVILDQLMQIMKPKKSLVLAFDGPAPFAKMQTQRSRRESSPLNSMITPGTDFMSNMENIMLCYVLQRLRRPMLSNITVYISGSNAPGEGELKLIDWIRSLKPSEDETLAICGSDSDIILQAVCLPNHPNTFVLQSGRDSKGMSACNVTSLLEQLQHGLWLDDLSGNSNNNNSNNNSGSNGYTNITTKKKKKGKKDKLSNKIGPLHFTTINNNNTMTLTNTNTTKTTTSCSNVDTTPASLRLDAVLLFILQGNDYLPKLRGITMSRALRAYSKVMRRKPFTQHRGLLDLDNNTFDFQALMELCDTLDCNSNPMWNGVPSAGGARSWVSLPCSPPLVLYTLNTLLQTRKKKRQEIAFDIKKKNHNEVSLALSDETNIQLNEHIDIVRKALAPEEKLEIIEVVNEWGPDDLYCWTDRFVCVCVGAGDNVPITGEEVDTTTTTTTTSSNNNNNNNNNNNTG